MSGIYSSIENYDGKQGNTVQSIKQFTFSDKLSTAFWTYKRGSTVGAPIIVPANQNSSVLINKDLTVIGSINNLSDVKTKENIQNITSVVSDTLLNLEPVSFNYLSDEKEHYGFIAQDVEKLFPLLVNYNESIECKTVNYIELIPLMINKMKKMQEEIDHLKEEINTRE
jgi:hypothetical protein